MLQLTRTTSWESLSRNRLLERIDTASLKVSTLPSMVHSRPPNMHRNAMAMEWVYPLSERQDEAVLTCSIG